MEREEIFAKVLAGEKVIIEVDNTVTDYRTVLIKELERLQLINAGTSDISKKAEVYEILQNFTVSYKSGTRGPVDLKSKGCLIFVEKQLKLNFIEPSNNTYGNTKTTSSWSTPL